MEVSKFLELYKELKDRMVKSSNELDLIKRDLRHLEAYAYQTGIVKDKKEFLSEV